MRGGAFCAHPGTQPPFLTPLKLTPRPHAPLHPTPPHPTPHPSYFGTGGGWCGGGGPQPTVLADLENGLWGCDVPAHAPANASLPYPFVTAMLKGGVGSFALKGGDATAGALDTFYSGPRPAGYEVMKKTGAIILGVGGDNVARRRGRWQGERDQGNSRDTIPGTSIGTMFEAVMTSGYTSEATDAAIALNIMAAGYGQ